MSRIVKAALFSSIDGVVDEPYKFQYDSFDARMGELMTEAIAPVTDVVMGRTTYSQWSEYWPTDQAPAEDDPFRNFINPVAKHVASRTLTQDDLTWENSTLIDGQLVDYVQALKAQPGGDISVTGSLSVVRQLVAAGVLDRLTLMVHPAVAGSGERLFDGFEPTRFELLEHDITPAGNVVVTYGLRTTA